MTFTTPSPHVSSFREIEIFVIDAEVYKTFVEDHLLHTKIQWHLIL